MTDRQGVEIDYCPGCRGIWLDRGELDKVIERSTHDRAFAGDHDDDDDARVTGKRGGSHRRRRSWLGEMFDFGD